MEDTKQKILSRVLMFLSYRPRTTKEVNQRLERYLKSIRDLVDADRTEISTWVLEYLGSNKLIDDDEFARVYIESRICGKNILGKKSLVNNLIQKGFSKESASSLVENIVNDEDENKLAVRALEKKFKGGPKELDRNKMGRYLLTRGFSYPVSRQAVDYFLKGP